MGAGGRVWAATALQMADDEGLNARKIVAQGKASLRATPWVIVPKNTSPERAAESLAQYGATIASNFRSLKS